MKLKTPRTAPLAPRRPAVGEPILRIALPNKGRLAQDTRDLFDDAGLEVRALSDRALRASLGGEFEAIFVRSQDIPEFVAERAADADLLSRLAMKTSSLPWKSYHRVLGLPHPSPISPRAFSITRVST